MAANDVFPCLTGDFIKRTGPKAAEMAAQIISLVKLVGSAAQEAGQLLDRWSAGGTTHGALQALLQALVRHACVPPIAYFSQHADLWSLGDVFDRCFPQDSATAPSGDRQPDSLRSSAKRLNMSEELQCWFYSLPDDGCLERHLASEAHQEWTAQADEYRWLTVRLHEAAAAWAPLAPEGLLLLFRELKGGLVTDEEFLASRSALPPTLATALNASQH